MLLDENQQIQGVDPTISGMRKDKMRQNNKIILIYIYIKK
jgi:hypothetical protein